ncbi:MAG: TIGR02677 family protein [Gaiellaceae bacterium]
MAAPLWRARRTAGEDLFDVGEHVSVAGRQGTVQMGGEVSVQVPGASDSRLRVFAYATSPSAETYLAIVESLAEAKERFRLQFRPVEIVELLGGSYSVDGVSAALDQLVEWGNVARVYDSAAAETLEEFYRRRFLYQLTPEGIVAHDGVRAVQAAGLDEAGRLSSVLLPAIAERLEAVLVEADGERDPARLYALFGDLFSTCEELADNTNRYVETLSVEVTELSSDDDRFQHYKQAVLAYLDQFVSSLGEWIPRINGLIDEVGPNAEELLATAATADAAPLVTGEMDAGPVESLRRRWNGMAVWFAGDDEHPSVAHSLGEATLTAINSILFVVRRISERLVRRVSREEDFMQLARWFVVLDGDRAHGLWDSAFGLYSSRHLDGVAGDEDHDRRASFWEAEPVEVAARLRASGTRGSPGRPGHGADFSVAKAAKVAAMRAAAEQARVALAALSARTPVRLAQLGALESSEFAQLLDLVGLALESPPGAVRRASGANVTVTLADPDPSVEVVVQTSSGRLRTMDWSISIELTDRPALHQVAR